MSDFPRRVVEWALTKVGRPYIWGSCGPVTWTPNGMKSTLDVASASEAYDCVGLVKAAAMACGGTDVRATENAQTLFDELPHPALGEIFTLRFYGTASRIQHVSFDLGSGLRLEAAGGDHTTTDLAKSLSRPHAVVRVGFELRNDFVGYRSLAALERFTKGTS